MGKSKINKGESCAYHFPAPCPPPQPILSTKPGRNRPGNPQNLPTTAELGINARIELIDGTQLAELLVAHEVGVQAETTATLYRLDEDFFETL